MAMDAYKKNFNSIFLKNKKVNKKVTKKVNKNPTKSVAPKVVAKKKPVTTTTRTISAGATAHGPTYKVAETASKISKVSRAAGVVGGPLAMVGLAADVVANPGLRHPVYGNIVKTMERTKQAKPQKGGIIEKTINKNKEGELKPLDSSAKSLEETYSKGGRIALDSRTINEAASNIKKVKSDNKNSAKKAQKDAYENKVSSEVNVLPITKVINVAKLKTMPLTTNGAIPNKAAPAIKQLNNREAGEQKIPFMHEAYAEKNLSSREFNRLSQKKQNKMMYDYHMRNKSN